MSDVRFGIWLIFFRCFAFGVFQSLNKFVEDLDDLCYAKHEQAVEKTFKLPVILNAMTLMWHHCNGFTLCSLQLKKLLSQSMSKSQTGFRTEVCPKNVWIRLPRSLQIPDCETRIVSIEHMFAEFRHGNIVSTTILMSPQPFKFVWTSLSPTIWFSRSILDYRTSLKLFWQDVLEATDVIWEATCSSQNVGERFATVQVSAHAERKCGWLETGALFTNMG